jgi:NADPH:quinone reductase-like Zn-dependent oxidoreductase
MRAIVQDRYGPPEVLRLEERDPPAVADDQVLVRIEAASVNPADWHFMRGEPYLARLQAGLRTPKAAVLGGDLAGRVEAAGSEVDTLKPGDEVFGCSFMRGFGAFADYAAVPHEIFRPKPKSLAAGEAAAMPLAAVTALQGLRDAAGLEAGERILIIGASGGVGTFAVQIAKHSGAEVTGVCSGRNVDLVRSLGADHVIDYTDEDLDEHTGSYDVVLQLAGERSPSALRRLTTADGKVVLSSGESAGKVIGPMGRVVKAMLLSPFVAQMLTTFTMKPSGEDLDEVTKLVEAGALRPVIDRTYPLEEVPEAITYLETGRARGKVVIEVSSA